MTSRPQKKRRYEDQRTNKECNKTAQEINWKRAAHVIRLDHNRWARAAVINGTQIADQDGQTDQEPDERTTRRNKLKIYGPEERGTGITTRNTSVKSGSTKTGVKSEIKYSRK